MIKKVFIFIFSFLFIITTVPYFKKTRAEWIKFQNNPIIPEKVDKKELINNPRSPAILLENGVIKMWFMNQIDNRWHLDLITSTDGVNWIKPFSRVLLSPDINEVEIGQPTILKINNVYHLWYTVLNSQDSFYKIRHAWSNNGYDWEKDEKLALSPTKWWETKGVVNPYVLYINNQYWMWYGAWGIDGVWRIGLVKSNNGINWDENEKIILNISPNIQHVGNHNLKYFDNNFHLWYLTGNGNEEEIYELTSYDGINWSCNKESCLVLKKDFINFPNSVLNDSDTVLFEEKILIYFTGIHNGKWGIGIASNKELNLNPRKSLILLPGLFASWNKEAILHNQQVSIFDWKLNPFVREYDGIINTVKNLGFVENQDFYVFPYDWRKNLDQSSEDLKNFINSKIPQQEKKINLIGHSLGGLLARIFTQKYKERVNKVITVGSPHQGAVQVYKPLSAGEIDRENTFLWLAQKIILILNKTSIETDRETLRKKFPVAYDLFPTFNFLKNQQNQEIPTENLSIKNNLLTAYNQTFSQIFDIFTAFYGEKDNQTPAGYVVTQANLFHQTLGNYQDGQPVDIYYEPGDYTVLSKSANKDTDSEKLNFDHGEIITKRESIKKILNKIDLFPEDGQIEEGRKTKISPSLIFLIKSPVKMTLKTPDSQLIEETDGIIFLDNPQSGNYQLQLQGIEKGKYTLIIGQITNQNDIWEIKEGEISQTPPSSQTDRYNFYFNNNLANPIFPTPTPTATLIPTPTITPTPSPTLILISTPTITPTSNSSFANQSSTHSQNNHSSISSNNSPTNLLSRNAAPISLSRASKNNKSEVLGAQNKKSNNQKINNNNNKNKQKYLIIVGFLISLSLIFTAFLSLRKFKKNVDPEGIEPSTFRM